MKKLLHEGNVRHIVIKQDGHTILEMPLTFGVVGVLVARLVKPGMGFFWVETAWRTLQRDEPMTMLRKGQVQGVNKGGIAEEHKNCSHICPPHFVFKQPCGLPGRHERPVYADEYLVRIVDGREPRLTRL